MTPPLNEKARLSVPVTLAWTVMVSAVTGAIGATATAYALRDQMLDRLQRDVSQAMATMRDERKAELKYYLDKETWQEWKAAERERQDHRYFSLLNSTERLQVRMERR